MEITGNVTRIEELAEAEHVNVSDTKKYEMTNYTWSDERNVTDIPEQAIKISGMLNMTFYLVQNEELERNWDEFELSPSSYDPRRGSLEDYLNDYA